MATALSPPPEQGQLVSVRERRFIVTDVARGTLPDSPLRPSGNGAQHLVSLSSVEDDALGEELQVFWPPTAMGGEILLDRIELLRNLDEVESPK